MAEKILAWEHRNMRLIGLIIIAALAVIGIAFYANTGDIMMLGAVVGGGYFAIIVLNVAIVTIACVIDRWRDRRTC